MRIIVLVLHCLLQTLLKLIVLLLIPTYGIADNRLVITVAQNICPHGNTYPRNAVAIVRNRIANPTDHVCINLYDP
jgi:hypothetical protein